MSGSGGGGGGFVDVGDVACSNLRLQIQIATPDPVGIATVLVGMVLTVTLQHLGGHQVVALFNGATRVGGLAGGQVSRLRDCLAAGTNYSATVQSISGPRVLVNIEPV
ncbi:hypothetical protein QTH97_27205 [Variovorax sp. J22R24]|uniref:hypothetical protein n=1 Tax=Variovorax gracilis TaxID=3053502 RepID=UPI0025766900|nr:hypothetical protein [Variovorax sp. J22R24]MDM0108664.1 hypothetical protein [Variovorax sp. J22R24]